MDTERGSVQLNGRVAYDVENREWVMWEDGAFVAMGPLYAGINEYLIGRGLPRLKVGDEISLTIRRG